MSQPTVSLITSLYRSEAHIARYSQHAQALAATLRDAGIRLQVVLVANDPTPAEQAHIQALQQQPMLDLRVIEVPRESVYASWNRGFDAADADWLGVWNVDDVRDAQAMIVACEQFAAGADLIDMPLQTVSARGIRSIQHALYDPVMLSPKRCISPFFMVTRRLYTQAGGFNPLFKISGDLEWCWRPAVRQARYVPLTQTGGQMMLHGNNLSNGTHPLEWVEINVVLLWHSLYDQLRPVDPDLMREVWNDWAGAHAELPAPIANWLWGPQAAGRYQAYQRERNSPAWLRRLRLTLARRGLMRSAEWDAHHAPKARHHLT